MEYRSSQFVKQLNTKFLSRLFILLPLSALPYPLLNLLYNIEHRIPLISVLACAVLIACTSLYLIAPKLSFKHKTYALLFLAIAQSVSLMFADMPLASFSYWLFAYTLSALCFGMRTSMAIIITAIPMFTISSSPSLLNEFSPTQNTLSYFLTTAASVSPFMIIIGYFREYLMNSDLNQQQELKTLKYDMHAQVRILKSVINSGPVRMFWKDEKGYYLGCNKQFSEDVGLDNENLIAGLKASDLFGVERGKQLELDDQRAMSLDIPQPSFENRTFNDQGEERWLLTNKNKFSDKDNNLLGTCAYYFDITSLKMVESQLIHSRAIAESSNRAKSQFLINISHEFRTFSNSIMGLSQTALKQTLSPDLQEYLNLIYQNSERLLTLTNDILDFSHIESGKLYLERTPFAIKKLANELRNAFEKKAIAKELNLTINIDNELPNYLLGDFQRIYQICYNLLDNAIKFTDIGKVSVRFSEFKSKEQSMFQIHIEDTGPGISRAIRETIFEPFSVSDKLKKNRNGNGLGLAITRGLVSQMHGEIWVTNNDHSGCHFVVQVPLNEAIDFEKNHIGTADNFSFDFTHRQILLIENDKHDGISIAQALKQRNAYVNLFDNYDEGIQQCLIRQFDCIVISDAFTNADLMDLPMKFLQQSTLKSAPIFLLTSNIDDHFRRLCKEKGFAGLISKPVNFHVLFNDIQQAIINFHHNRTK